jgi:hypothetical protein
MVSTSAGVYRRETIWSTANGLRVITVRVSWADAMDNSEQKRHYVMASRQKVPQ